MSEKVRVAALLQQASSLALYVAAGLATSQNGQSPSRIQTRDRDSSEVFSTESAPWGSMIPNTVKHLGPASSRFRLNTPPPLMCTSPAPPNQADPFRRGPHAFRDLGGPTQMSRDGVRTVLQLSPEEDQAITCLLKLRYQGPKDSQVKLRNIVLETFHGNERELTKSKVARGGFGPTDEGTPGAPAAPPSGAGWKEFRQIDAVEHYEEYLLPIPPPSTHERRP
ncbi:uncharacterized protein LOC133473009 [Phyllopteryx taeniolatus]|uniref:uncharacterized protein LOC133473009 n=1 Tax=Phyllopteryx taeniolatus TaxID=161469 RepID=UPI002AD2959F|nr:uncharacterized protein LOC133473009 [Phyllopteryx taeniolatus]